MNKTDDFIEQAAKHSGEACLVWPYTRGKNGRGIVARSGKLLIASRLVCEKRHGPAPADRPHALHRCGNGRGGCVAGNHVYWGTPKDNAADDKRLGVKRGRPRTRAEKPKETRVPGSFDRYARGAQTA